MAGAMRVLLIGGAPEVERVVRALLGDEAELRVDENLSSGLGALADGPWDVTLLSLELAGVGPELVERVSSRAQAGTIVLLTDRATPQQALEATRLGAADLLEHPLDVEALGAVLQRISVRETRIALPTGDRTGVMVGRSPGLLRVLKMVGRVAKSAATVLITGESGTGKELIARALHEAGERPRAPFIPVNCAAIPEDLLESELFGHERGAFTGAVGRKIGRFERAHGGTLFLDEIGDMSLVLQAKILRALQEREIERLGGEERIAVDVRVIAATHRDLRALVASGEYREDLYYRLAVVQLHLPPLRERTGDVRELALFYAARLAAEHERPLRYFSTAALERLEGHSWPGNVRELRNVIERAVLLSGGDTIREEDIQLDLPAAPSPQGAVLPGYSWDLSLAEMEALHIGRVLEEVEGQLGRAAEVLGVHRNTVSRKVQEYGLRTR